MKKQPNNVSGNLWKYFLFKLTHRRHFIPILSIFFLTLPNTTAQQIGIYVGAGFLASFLLEIPSGYFADRFGHKNTLILAKLLMIASMLSFIFANALLLFVLGSIFLAVSQAFTSGTDKVFMYETLIQLKREKDYTKIVSKINANVSLMAVFLTILLPFTTAISITTPLKINLVFDFIGFFIALMLVTPKKEVEITKESPDKFFKIVKNSVNPGFYMLALFTGVAGGFLIATSGFREAYLQFLGLPIVYLGFVMGLSRLVWFVVGHRAHWLEEKIGLKNLLKIEILLFPLFFILAAVFSDPYVVGIMILIPIGYYWGRSQIIEGYALKHLIRNKKYKATMLSVKSQVSLIIRAITSFLIGYVMVYSYKLGYVILGTVLFFALLISYIFLNKYLSK